MKKNHYSHFILYAKGHYKGFEIDGTVWGDLRRINANYCGVDEKHISNTDILYVLIHAVESVCEKVSLLDFLTEIDPENIWRTWPNRVGKSQDIKYDFKTAVVGKCLSLLRFVRVLDDEGNQILKLGEPDPKILTLKKGD